MRGLDHVLWIGGPPGAGKSTVAARLARRYGLRLYGTDTRTWQHRDRAIRDGNAAARRWEALTPRQRWEESTPQEMFAMSLHHERGPMVLDDLRELPTSPLVVAEGTTIPVDAVRSGLAQRSRTVWLIPTPQFQQATLTARQLGAGARTLYLLIGETIQRDVREQELPTLTVDGTRTVDQTVDAVAELFAEALDRGPCAGTRAERRALLVEANDAVVAQVRGFFARPWACGDADASAQRFHCECAAPYCDATVQVPLAALVMRPLLAPGHAK